MVFVRYVERAAALLNARLDTVEDVRGYLTGRNDLLERVAEQDGRVLRGFQRDLRPLFEHAAVGADEAMVDELNALLNKHPVVPRIVDGSADGHPWQLHVGSRSTSAAEPVVAEALLGLALLACDRGPVRLGLCRAAGCEAGYVDTSPNRSRRYCSERCSSRANVAAYRARQKASR